MSTYAHIYFAETEEDIPIDTFLMKLPTRLKQSIIKWKLPIKTDTTTMWGVTGEQIQIPMTYTMYRKMNSSMKSAVFKKIEKKLLQRDITHVLLPTTIKTSPFSNIQNCKGDYIKPFFIMEVIRFIVDRKMVTKDLKDLEVIILDGNEKEVDMIIEFIYPHINYLTIITDAPERFTTKIQNIFEDVGLNVQISSYNNPTISQGDIIIDTHYDDPGIIHCCKRQAIYIDISNHIEKTVMLLEKQNTVNIIDDFFLMYKQEALNTIKAELIFTLKGMFQLDYKEVRSTIKKEKIEVSHIKVDKL